MNVTANLDMLLDKAIKGVLCGAGGISNQLPISMLDFRHCQLRSVPKEIVKFRKSLEELYLDSNNVGSMSRSLFQCQMLKCLTMSDNEIYVVPSYINCLWNLRELNLSKNAILEIPISIRNCKYLHTLDLSVNPLGRLPEGITQIMCLTHLHLNDCFLDYLPANFGRLSQLVVLELRGNNIKFLPKSIIHLTVLERLDIGCNDLTELPECIGNLVALEELWADKNKIRRLPQALGKLGSLEFLELSCNCISSLPDSMCRGGGMGKIRDLYLQENMIHKLPADFGRLTSLTNINLSDNNTMELPTSFGNLLELTELNLNKNSLLSLPCEIGKLVNLRILYLDNNQLTSIPKEIGFCVKLRVFSAAKNDLEELPVEIGMCRHLRVINLVYNRLTDLPYSLTNCKHLNALWLSDNQGAPLLPFQAHTNEVGVKVLTSYMFPQPMQAEGDLEAIGGAGSDTESLTSSIWEAETSRNPVVAIPLVSNGMATRLQLDSPNFTVFVVRNEKEQVEESALRWRVRKKQKSDKKLRRGDTARSNMQGKMKSIMFRDTATEYRKRCKVAFKIDNEYLRNHHQHSGGMNGETANGGSAGRPTVYYPKETPGYFRGQRFAAAAAAGPVQYAMVRGQAAGRLANQGSCEYIDQVLPYYHSNSSTSPATFTPNGSTTPRMQRSAVSNNDLQMLHQNGYRIASAPNEIFVERGGGGHLSDKSGTPCGGYSPPAYNDCNTNNYITGGGALKKPPLINKMSIETTMN